MKSGAARRLNAAPTSQFLRTRIHVKYKHRGSAAVKTLLVAISALAGFLVAAWGWAEIFHPQFFNFDFYHYLTLAHDPVAHGSHPFIFGYLLRLLAWLGNLLPDGALPHVFQVWQFICLSALVWTSVGRDRPPGSLAEKRGVWSCLAGLGVCLLGALVLMPGLVFLMNGYLTEMTALLVTVLASRCVAGIGGPRHVRAAAGLAALSLVGYHLRYQLAIIPVAALVVLTLDEIRGRKRLTVLTSRAVALGVLVAAFPLSHLALSVRLPVDEFGRNLPSRYLRGSIQCRLKCDVRLYEVGCRTQANRDVVMRATCTDLVHGLVSLGEPVQLGRSWPEILHETGWANVVRWLFLAPATYLRERMPTLAIETYAYDGNVRWLSEHHPTTIQHYERVFPTTDRGPSGAFRFVVDYLKTLYFSWSLHWVSMIVVWVSVVLTLVSRDRVASFFAASSVGTFLVFSYVQPQAPLRYLLVICLLGGLSLLRVSATCRLRKPGCGSRTDHAARTSAV